MNEHSWAVIPALPGTWLEWDAEWCTPGRVRVHAWLVAIDVDMSEDEERCGHDGVDVSCCTGQPMILDSGGELAVARMADLAGKPGQLIEP